MPVCTICQSTNLVEVEDALSAGVAVREIASRFGFSKSAVGRHRAQCLAPKLAAAARIMAPAAEVRAPVERAKSIAAGHVAPTSGDALSLNGLLARLERSLSRLEGAADTAAADGLHAALAAVSGQLHRGIEVAGKMQGIGVQPNDAAERFTINITVPTVAAVAPVAIAGEMGGDALGAPPTACAPVAIYGDHALPIVHVKFP